MARNIEPKWSTKWEKALANIDNKEIRERMNRFHEEAMSCAAVRLAFGSPLLIVMIIVATPFVAIRFGIHSVKQLFTASPKYTISHIPLVDTQMIENEAALLATA
jgi:hypothetical protein